MREPNKYKALRLREETLDKLRIMKRAFEIAYRKDFTNDDFISQMAASVEDGDPAVWEFYCGMKDAEDKAIKKAKALHK